MKFKAISIAASVALLGLLLLYSNISEVAKSLSSSKPEFIATGILVSTLAMAARTMRWKWLLKSISVDISFRAAFPVFMAGLFVSNITPAKSGEPFRSYLLKRKTGTGFTNSISSVIIERVFDLLTLIAISIAGVLFIQGFIFALLLNMVVSAYMAIIAVIVIVCTSTKRIEWFSSVLLKAFGWIPLIKKLGGRLEEKAGNINQSFMKYGSVGIITKLSAFSLFIWSLDGAIGYLAFMALGIEINLPVFVFIMAVSVLIGIATSLPGGIGSADAVMALLVSSLMPIGLPLATAGILLFRFMTIWYNVAIGAFLLSSVRK